MRNGKKTWCCTRFGDPSEIASGVVFLASSLSSYCQGTILDIDGGQTRTL
ncbi:MAG: SDR family oxidoreductase [Proteobacteria bacterium]|nr:SDR family oxidoreductase [Pseudomonadota bacterium]